MLSCIVVRIFEFCGSNNCGISRQNERQGQLLGRRLRQPGNEVSGGDLLQGRNAIRPGRQILLGGKLQEVARSTKVARPPTEVASRRPE
jgi:hypothetical protein